MHLGRPIRFVLVACAYAVAVRVGLALRVSGSPVAAVWPANGLLLGLLLVLPRRDWRWGLPAGLAGHLVATWEMGLPVYRLFWQYGFNSTFSVGTALPLLRVLGGTPRFDRLRHAVVLAVFASLGAAACSFFAPATVMHFLGREGHHGTWGVAWWTVFLSNFLGVLAVTPAVCRVLSPPDAQPAVPSRAREAALLLALVLVVSHLAFSHGWSGNSVRVALVYLPVPLLLWAAVRLGPAAASISLFAVGFVAIRGAIEARGLPSRLPIVSDTSALQVLLVSIGLPLLLLAANADEARGVAVALARSERRVRRQLAELASVYRTAPVGLAFIDAELRFVNVNDAFAAEEKAVPESFVGRAVADAAPSMADVLVPELERVLAFGEPLIGREVRRPAAQATQDEDRVWLVSHFPVRDDLGAVIGINTVVQDITERKRAEEQRRALVAQRATSEALRESDRRKDEFLALLAHELRNPLAPVAVAVELLQRRSDVHPDVAWAAAMIDRQLGQLRRLVDDLLDLARITRGKINLQLAPVQVESVVMRAVELCRPLVEERAHQLSVHVPNGACTVLGDFLRLTQVVTNLLNNAAKYTARGGHIELAVDTRGEDVFLTVRDDGEGIAPEMIAHVFDPFVQCGHPSERSEGGLGIGLTLVQSLVQLHEGVVEARSAGLGHGSTFTVRLPRLPAASLAAVRERETRDEARLPLASERARRKVLVVDDNADVAESLARLLAEELHEVQVASDGLAALGVIRAFDPDVVLLDLGMPRMNGLEVARAVRAERPNGSGPRLVALTGFGQEADRQRTREAGFDHHLVKPVDPLELLRVVDDAG